MAGGKYDEYVFRHDIDERANKVTPEGRDAFDLDLGRRIMKFLDDNAPQRRPQKD